MTLCGYEIVIAGGGLGGATPGRALANAGVHTLIVERETTFTDRVRGEGIFPWGVVEARSLGVERLLLDDGAHVAPFWMRYAGPGRSDCRNLAATTPAHTACLDFYHPAMQRTLLDAAQVFRGNGMARRRSRGHRTHGQGGPCPGRRDQNG
jgi:menaquinone-9 beta-reductase